MDPSAQPDAHRRELEGGPGPAQPSLAGHPGTKMHRCPALQSSLDITEADVGRGIQPHHLIPPGAGERAAQVLRRMEEEPPTDIDQARGLGPEPDEELGPGGEPRQRADRHHGDGSRGPVGAESDEDLRTGYGGGGGSGASWGGYGGGGGFCSGSSTLWGPAAEAEGRGDVGGGGTDAGMITSGGGGGGGLEVTGRLDERVPGWSPAEGEAAELAATCIELGSEAQVREAERRISGGRVNTGDFLSHPERFGPHGGAPSGSPPPPRYRGHLAADPRAAAMMGSQSAVRAVEAEISLHHLPPSPPSAADDDSGPVSGQPPSRPAEAGGVATGGGAAGAAATAGGKAALSVGKAAERAAAAAAAAATYARDTARTAGQLLGNAARRMAEDAAAAATHGSEEGRKADADTEPSERDHAP